MTEGNDGGGREGGLVRRRREEERAAHAEAGCDWWMEGVERMKGEMGSIFFTLRAFCTVPKIGSISATSSVYSK